MITFLKQKLFIVAPHPDDEVLGCGGLIKRVKNDGGSVHVVFMTVGDTKEYSENGSSHAADRRREIEAVAKFLDYDDYKILYPGDEYHLQLDRLAQRDIIGELENELNVIQPTIVATPWAKDYNQDHRCVSQAVFAATRPVPKNMKPLQETVIGYECVATADWWDKPRSANMFVELKDHELRAKLDALKLYASQIRPRYHVRSLQAVKNLAHYRGIAAGVKAAEAFYCYRHIV